MRRKIHRLTTLFTVFALCVTSTLQAQQIPRLAMSVDWNLDGSRIAIAFTDGTVDVQDTQSGQVIYTSPPVRGETITDLEWSNHNSDLLAFLVSGSTVHTIHLGLSEPSDSFIVEGDSLSSLAWHPTLNQLAVGVNEEYPIEGSDGAINIYDMETYQPINRLGFYENAVSGVAWSPDGTHIASGGLNYDQNGDLEWEFTIWNVANPSNPIRVPTNGDGYLAWISNSVLVIGSGIEGVLQFLNASDGSVMDHLSFQSPIRDLIYNQTTNTLAFHIRARETSLDKGIYIVSAASHAILYRFTDYPSIVDIDVSPDGSQLAYIEQGETATAPIIIPVAELPTYIPQSSSTPTPSVAPTSGR